MKVSRFILIGFAVLLLAAAGFRGLQVLPYPMGGGRDQKSPDGRLVAHAYSLWDRFFWGGERQYYEFSIEASPQRTLRRIVIDEPPEGVIGWREEGVIEWAADSSAVTYTFRGTRLVLSVKP